MIIPVGLDTAVELRIEHLGRGGFRFDSYVKLYDMRRVRRALRRFKKGNPFMTAPLRHLNLSGRRFR